MLKYGLLLILLPVFQLSIFNNINLLGYIDPYFYIIFIIVYPFKKDRTSLLLSSFLLGIFIDLLTNDGGIHTFSLVFIAYFRRIPLQVFASKTPLELEETSIQNINFPVLFLWVSSLTLIHHFLVFLLEQFSFEDFGNLLLKTFLSAVLTILLILFSLQLFLTKKSNAQ